MNSQRLQELEARKAKLDERRAKLADEIRKVEARQREAEKKLQTRKRILIGAYVLHQIDTGAMQESELMSGLAGYLERKTDRELFGLPPLDSDGGEPSAVENG